MDDVERIPFDFQGGGAADALAKLEDILSSGHWSDHGPDYTDERTKLLLWLLQVGGITVYKRRFSHRTDVSPELEQRAGMLRSLMGKRNPSQAMIDIADIFSGYEYDTGRTEYNALFFPELKAFVRCGGIPPDRLLDLLECDGCDAVMLFPDAYGEDCFYAFARAMPREDFLSVMDDMRSKTAEVLYEAIQKAEKDGTLPKIPVIHFPEDTTE